MATRSRIEYQGRLTDRERDDLLQSIARYIHNLSNRVASLETWRGATTINQQEGDNENLNNYEGLNDDHDAGSNDSQPRRTATRPNAMNRNYPFNRAPVHGSYEQFLEQNYNYDDITKRVRVDVPDFSVKLDPQAFTDWITALEDYFDW